MHRTFSQQNLFSGAAAATLAPLGKSHAVMAMIAMIAITTATTACSGAPEADSPTAASLSATTALADRSPGTPAYAVTDLGTLGGAFSVAFGINNLGHVAGGANGPDQVSHFALWRDRKVTDAGSLGGNANAAINRWDELAGLSETAALDPHGEDFCGFGTHHVCVAAVWFHGVLTALPTLGGMNAQAANLNDRGQVVGMAETNVRDASCSAGTPFQAYRYQAAVWGPKPTEVRALPPFPGDDVGFAIGLNERDQFVGSTGTCATTLINGRTAGPHAVLWDHGVPISLDAPGSHNTISVAASINDLGQIVGGSGSSALHSFLWTRAGGKRDLGTVEADLGSFATGINARGDVVGISCTNDALCNTANPNLQGRAYLWQNGVMRDLNALVVGETSLYLVTAFGINDFGQIVGLAMNTELGELHAFVATPVSQHGGPREPRGARPSTLPDRVRALLRHRLELGGGK